MIEFNCLIMKLLFDISTLGIQGFCFSIGIERVLDIMGNGILIVTFISFCNILN